MRPTGFNIPYTATNPIHFTAEGTPLGERLPRSGDLLPGRVVWLAHEVGTASGGHCRAYVEDVGFIQTEVSVLSPVLGMSH